MYPRVVPAKSRLEAEAQPAELRTTDSPSGFRKVYELFRFVCLAWRSCGPQPGGNETGRTGCYTICNALPRQRTTGVLLDHRVWWYSTFGRRLQSREPKHIGNNQKSTSTRRSSGLRIRGAAYEFPNGRCKRRPAEIVGWQGSSSMFPEMISKPGLPYCVNVVRLRALAVPGVARMSRGGRVPVTVTSLAQVLFQDSKSDAVSRPVVKG